MELIFRCVISALVFMPAASYAASGNGQWYVSVLVNSTSLDKTTTEETQTLESCVASALGCSNSSATTRYKNSFDEDLSFSLIGGLRSDSVRMELEVNQLESRLDNDAVAGETLELTMVTINAWKDFEIYGFTPYAGGGIGLGLMEQGNLDGEFVLARLGIGLNVELFDNLAVDLGYRLLLAEPDPVMEGSGREIIRDIRGSSIVFGARYIF